MSFFTNKRILTLVIIPFILVSFYHESSKKNVPSLNPIIKISPKKMIVLNKKEFQIAKVKFWNPIYFESDGAKYISLTCKINTPKNYKLIFPCCKIKSGKSKKIYDKTFLIFSTHIKKNKKINRCSFSYKIEGKQKGKSTLDLGLLRIVNLKKSDTIVQPMQIMLTFQ